MKLLKSVKSMPTAMVAIAMITLALGGCGKVTSPDSTDGGSGGGSVGGSFTVTPGGYERRQVTGDGKISFNVTGIDMDLDKDAQPIVCFYDDQGYTGGRGDAGFNGELRNYKLKYYGTSGQIESEKYHGYTFKSTQTYSVVLEWKTGSSGYMRSTVDGQVFEAGGEVADTFTLGIGYPPAVRVGWDDAVYTNIVWPSGSTEVK